MFVTNTHQDRRLRADPLLRVRCAWATCPPTGSCSLAYAVVGLGAAAYSPAKYGILTELLPPEQLVDRQRLDRGAHGAAPSCSAPAGRRAHRPEGLRRCCSRSTCRSSTPASTRRPEAAIVVIAVVYVIAACFNLAIPDTGARYPAPGAQPVAPAGRLLRLLHHALARQARADLARDDHALLGRRRHAAVHRAQVGREAASTCRSPRARCCRASRRWASRWARCSRRASCRSSALRSCCPSASPWDSS